MSGLMHKVKDALSGEKNTPEARAANQGNHEYGSSTTYHEGISGSGHKSGIDPLDSDLTGKQSGAGYDSTSSGYGQSTGTTGGDYGRDTSATGAGYGSTSYDDNSRTSGAGRHSSGLANKADPRIDSDRDGKSSLSGSGTTGDSYGRDTTSGGGYGSGASGLGGSGYDDNTRTSGAGPHSSSLANKADPRVGSDRDGRSGLGGSGSGYGNTSSTGGLGSSGYDDTTGSGGIGGTGRSHHHGGGISGKVDDLVHGGEHHTQTANALDPHVSGGSGSGSLESGYGAGATGGGLGSTASGSGYDNTTGSGLTGGSSGYDNSSGTGLTGGSTSGYGNDRSTGSGLGGSSGYANDRTSGAGPHSSSLANKADPRVDSDRDGRSGIGGTGSSYDNDRTTGSGGYGGTTGTGNY